MLAQALGSTFTTAQQLPALQASYRHMEELARQTAANDALAELADQKAMMERVARAPAPGPAPSPPTWRVLAEEAAAAEAAAGAEAVELAAELRVGGGGGGRARAAGRRRAPASKLSSRRPTLRR